MTRGQVGLALSVVLSMTLGIIVDDTIHFFLSPTLLMRFDREDGKLAAVREPQMDQQVSCL